MARLTPNHVVEIADLRARTLARFAGARKVVASASQVGSGVVLALPGNVTLDRMAWEEFKQAVEAAFRDDQEIPCKDPIW